jgi:4-aminobutyrate aminotransferase
MPIGAFIAREEISTWKPGAHGSTFGGNPVCCAAALATLDLVERELMPNARVQGERLLNGLNKLAEKHGVIGDVRGRGLMQGIELVMDRSTREPAGEHARKLMDLAFKKGLLTLAAGRNALRFAPPLVVDQEDVEIALNILEQSLSEMD